MSNSTSTNFLTQFVHDYSKSVRSQSLDLAKFDFSQLVSVLGLEINSTIISYSEVIIRMPDEFIVPEDIDSHSLFTQLLVFGTKFFNAQLFCLSSNETRSKFKRVSVDLDENLILDKTLIFKRVQASYMTFFILGKIKFDEHEVLPTFIRKVFNISTTTEFNEHMEELADFNFLNILSQSIIKIKKFRVSEIMARRIQIGIAGHRLLRAFLTVVKEVDEAFSNNEQELCALLLTLKVNTLYLNLHPELKSEDWKNAGSLNKVLGHFLAKTSSKEDLSRLCVKKILFSIPIELSSDEFDKIFLSVKEIFPSLEEEKIIIENGNLEIKK